MTIVLAFSCFGSDSPLLPPEIPPMISGGYGVGGARILFHPVLALNSIIIVKRDGNSSAIKNRIK